MTSSLAALNAEKQEQAKLAHEKKKKEGKDKESRKAKKAQKAKEEEKQSLPIVKELVLCGLAHCLSQVLSTKIKILKYHFKHSEAKTSLKVPCVNALLTDYFAAMHDEPTTLSVNESVGMRPLPSLSRDPSEYSC